MKPERWVDKWNIPSSSSPNKSYVVSQDAEGEYGCSCPHWKFRRKECHHIVQVKMNGGEMIIKEKRPEYVLANVCKVIFDEKNNRLFCPLVPFGNVSMEATIAYNLMKHGYSIGEVRDMRYHLPKSWTAKAIIDYVEQNGECEFNNKNHNKKGGVN